MVRWLLVLALLSQRATGLAGIPSVEQLTAQEPGRRTELDRSESLEVTANVADFGFVALQLRQQTGQPSSTMDVIEDTAFGSFVVLIVKPQRFVSNAACREAVHKAISMVDAVQRSAGRLKVSLAALEEFPLAVRVNFQLAFDSPKRRQAFLSEMHRSGISQLAMYICSQAPGAFGKGCRLPEDDASTLLQKSSGHVTSSEAVAEVLPSQPSPYGTIMVLLWVPLPEFLGNPAFQEALALSISEMAWCSRQEVSTLISVEANQSLRFNFWLLIEEHLQQAAIQRVTAAGAHIQQRAQWYVDIWNRVLLPNVWGNVMLNVPNPQRFASDKRAFDCVRKAVGLVAAAPGSKENHLSVVSSSASLSAADDAVRISFQVNFRKPYDRQVFTSEFAEDGAEKLATTINRQLPDMCNSSCLLPGYRKGEATSRVANVNFARTYGQIALFVSQPRRLLLPDVSFQDGLATALAQIAKVPRKQVGVLLLVEAQHRIRFDYWVTSSNRTARQLAILRSLWTSREKWSQCTLAAMDKNLTESVIRGSFMLEVPSSQGFAENAMVRKALTNALEQVVLVPGKEVFTTKVQPSQWSNDSPQVVQVDFEVSLGPEDGRQADLAQAIAWDGGERLVKSINARLPEPLQCWLPGQDRTKASATNSGGNKDVTSPPVTSGSSHGAMFVYVFEAPQFVRGQSMLDSMAETIAEVAAVPRTQVGVVMTAESRTLVRIDFWVASTNRTLRQAASERVNRGWTAANLTLALSRMKGSYGRPAWMVRGGTVNATGSVQRSRC